MYKTIEKASKIEIIEKKSRFIGEAHPIASLNEAIFIIEKVKSENKKANHNCYAYTFKDFQKYSDDGEPASTAGQPILNILNKEGIHNALIIVSRYFGGILLGSGGLVRIYSKVAKEALLDSKVIYMMPFIKFKIYFSYEFDKKIKYIFSNLNIKIQEIEYKDYIKIRALVREENKNDLIEKIKQISYNIQIEELELIYAQPE